MDFAMTEAELTGALTDLFAGAVAIPLIVILIKTNAHKRKEKKYWVSFFVCLCVSFLVGFAAHYLIRSELGQKITWVFLYFLLIETTSLFALLGICIYTKEKKPDPKLLKIFHSILLPFWLAVVIPETFFGKNMIIPCVAVCSVLGVFGFILILLSLIKHGEKSLLLPLLSVVLLLPAAFVQLKHDSFIHVVFDFDHNGIAHLLIAAAVIVLFLGARKRIKQD